jgi:hypothetical protein
MARWSVDVIRKRDPSPFRYFAKKYIGAPGWEVIKLPSGHDVMVDLPNELAAAIAKIA